MIHDTLMPIDDMPLCLLPPCHAASAMMLVILLMPPCCRLCLCRHDTPLRRHLHAADATRCLLIRHTCHADAIIRRRRYDDIIFAIIAMRCCHAAIDGARVISRVDKCR